MLVLANLNKNRVLYEFTVAHPMLVILLGFLILPNPLVGPGDCIKAISFLSVDPSL